MVATPKRPFVVCLRYLPDVKGVSAEAFDLADGERSRSIQQRQLPDVVNLKLPTRVSTTTQHTK